MENESNVVLKQRYNRLCKRSILMKKRKRKAQERYEQRMANITNLNLNSNENTIFSRRLRFLSLIEINADDKEKP